MIFCFHDAGAIIYDKRITAFLSAQLLLVRIFDSCLTDLICSRIGLVIFFFSSGQRFRRDQPGVADDV